MAGARTGDGGVPSPNLTILGGNPDDDLHEDGIRMFAALGPRRVQPPE